MNKGSYQIINISLARNIGRGSLRGEGGGVHSAQFRLNIQFCSIAAYRELEEGTMLWAATLGICSRGSGGMPQNNLSKMMHFSVFYFTLSPCLKLLSFFINYPPPSSKKTTTLKWLPYILICHCTSHLPWFIILYNYNFINVSHHYLTSGGYQVYL